MVPNKAFLTRGIGFHPERLASFEEALRNAKIADFNLVTVSSIFPPNCKLLDREEGLELLEPGQIVHCVLARCETDEKDRSIASAIGLAIPDDSNHYGYVSEYHAPGVNLNEAADYAEDLAIDMLATTLNLNADSDSAWNEQIDLYRLSDKIVDTKSIVAWTRTGVGWTCAVAALVFCSYK